MRKFLIFYFFIALMVPVLVFARLGVGVGIGKIELDKSLKPGGNYNLPPLPVLNTGDEPSDYGVIIEYHEKDAKYPQMWPNREWFSFNPEFFFLEPGQSQNIAIKLTIPIKTTPGEYFAYLEAHPIDKKADLGGGASIGVAAAAKLYFSVAPANIFQGVFYKVIFFFNNYTPWTYIGLVLVIGAALIVLFKKTFRFNVSIKKK